MIAEPFEFTDQQIAQLGHALGVSGEQLEVCLGFIQLGVETYLDLVAAREEVGSSRALERLQRRFSTVRSTAAEMASLLEMFSAHLAPALVRRMTLDDFAAGASREEFVDHDDAEFILHEIARTLRLISSYSDKIDDKMFRNVLRLPSAHANGMKSERLSLWPFLFHAWIRAGHELAKTQDGPLHRFVNIVHVALEIDPARSSTLVEAVEAHNKADASRWLRRIRNADRPQRLRSVGNTGAEET